MPVMWTIIGPATLSGITFLGIIVIFNGFFVASWIKGFQVNINISFIMNFNVHFSDGFRECDHEMLCYYCYRLTK